MIDSLDRLQTLGVLALLGVAYFFLKRWIDKRSQKVKAFLDKQHWFRIEAMPVQISDIKGVAEKHGWRLVETMPWENGASLYKFEKSSISALSYSDLLDILGDPKLPQSEASRSCRFQIKIRELSDYSET